MKLLLHICCAPCSVMCVKSLRAENIEPTGYWYNPNIHPYVEYRARRDSLLQYAGSVGMAMETNDFYGLRPFARAVAEEPDRRCVTCYAARMRETARFAAENGYTYFSTTLLYSVFQKHDLVRLAAEEAAEEFGVPFLYRDFRPLYREGQAEARALGLYIQKYCGCVFSEEERYHSALRKKLERAAKAAATPSEPESAKAVAERERETKADLRKAGLAFDAAVETEKK
jgi:predicted adenine nucleotide alpha hydrolase (AANH) superfamily ATPase